MFAVASLKYKENLPRDELSPDKARDALLEMSQNKTSRCLTLNGN